MSITFLKWTATEALLQFLALAELWINLFRRVDLIHRALKPNMKSNVSIRLDFPDPFGPITQVKF